MPYELLRGIHKVLLELDSGGRRGLRGRATKCSDLKKKAGGTAIEYITDQGSSSCKFKATVWPGGGARSSWRRDWEGAVLLVRQAGHRAGGALGTIPSNAIPGQPSAAGGVQLGSKPSTSSQSRTPRLLLCLE